MKIIYTLLVFVVLSSCSNQKLKEESFDLPANESLAMPLETIKANSIERKTYYNLDSIVHELKAVDSTFFKQYFSGLTFSNIKDHKLEFDPYSRYYFFDYKEVEDLALFSIIHNDEVGYDNLYHFTYDKEKNQMLYVDFLAATGSDGGQNNVDRLRYNQAGDSLIRMSSFEDWLDFNKGSSREYDSIVYQILFSKKGTKFLKLDSISRMDTVWIKN
ncbi:MAG: hypothetical protein LPJ89_07130 [Hymenobacteraceae bacterium]|nr:hypothetical protein [Hymenobacteraceae bacterium]MDX5395706.1 hypothetical protein [Hymenobacteraceae bacterium]MDX5443541.1 hypothetical protein [Hymenobacteraceae bacterium]MDX5511758.1 hypothetical protein [Hymenobacteraceae bacterium]